MPHRGLYCEAGRPCKRPRLPEPEIDRVKVVVIEDHPLLFDLYLEKLGSIRRIVVPNRSPVESFEDALSLFQVHSPDMIITDLSLTESHAEGFSILRALKRVPSPPIVVLTTAVYSPHNTDELCQHLRRSRFDAVFHKLDFEHILPYLDHKAMQLQSH